MMELLRAGLRLEWWPLRGQSGRVQLPAMGGSRTKRVWHQALRAIRLSNAGKGASQQTEASTRRPGRSAGTKDLPDGLQLHGAVAARRHDDASFPELIPGINKQHLLPLSRTGA